MLYLVIFLSFFIMGASSCSQKVPPLEKPFFMGNSKTSEIVGADKDISCASDEFNNYVCQTQEDFLEMFMLRFSCEKWKPGTKLIDADKIKIPSFGGKSGPP